MNYIRNFEVYREVSRLKPFTYTSQYPNLRFNQNRDITKFIINKRKNNPGVWFDEKLTIDDSYQIDEEIFIFSRRIHQEKRRHRSSLYYDCLKTILANLVESGSVIFSIKSQNAKRKKEGKQVFKRRFGERVLKACLKTMYCFGYIDLKIGHSGFCTQVSVNNEFKKHPMYLRIKEKIRMNGLNDKYFVVNNNPDQRVVLFNDEPETDRILKKNLKDLLDNKVENLYGECLPSYLKYTRIYTDFQNKKGGRFYSRIQNEKREHRKFWKIRGENVAELDIKSCHPKILYFRENVIHEGDCYYVPGYGPEYREIIKKTFQIMLNVTRPRVYAICYKIFKDHELVKGKKFFFRDLIRAIKEENKEIAHYFFQCVALDLQNIESEVCLKILKTCADYGFPVIAIHDSFVFPEGGLPLMQSVIYHAWFKQFNLTTHYLTKQKIYKDDVELN